MALNMPTFYKRTGSAIVFAIIMLAGLLWHPLAFVALICLVNVLCLREYFRLMQKVDRNAYWPAWIPWLIQALSLVLIGATSFDIGVQTIYTIMVVLMVVPAIALLASVLPVRNSLPALMQALGGLLYITLPMVALHAMYTANHILPVALILMIWTNDTMAYLVGSFIGKTPFSPISPKKTWEGTAGGAILTIVGAGIYGYFAHSHRLADWMALALCAAVAGTLGDLLESKLKRMADIKDSGTLMPGHGGALDRFDSLLVAAPFTAAYVLICM